MEKIYKTAKYCPIGKNALVNYASHVGNFIIVLMGQLLKIFPSCHR